MHLHVTNLGHTGAVSLLLVFQPAEVVEVSVVGHADVVDADIIDVDLHLFLRLVGRLHTLGHFLLQTVDDELIVRQQVAVVLDYQGLTALYRHIRYFHLIVTKGHQFGTGRELLYLQHLALLLVFNAHTIEFHLLVEQVDTSAVNLHLRPQTLLQGVDRPVNHLVLNCVGVQQQGSTHEDEHAYDDNAANNLKSQFESTHGSNIVYVLQRVSVW